MPLDFDIKFDSLHFVNGYKNRKIITTEIKGGNIFQINGKTITKTEYKTIFDYYTKEHKITDKTVYMSQHIWAENELNVFVSKHFEVMKQLDCGTFGQVYKIKHQLDN